MTIFLLLAGFLAIFSLERLADAPVSRSSTGLSLFSIAYDTFGHQL
jgi:hypothetical protein